MKTFSTVLWALSQYPDAVNPAQQSVTAALQHIKLQGSFALNLIMTYWRCSTFWTANAHSMSHLALWVAFHPACMPADV